MNILLPRFAFAGLLALVALGASGLAHAVPHDVILIVDNSGSMRKIDPQMLAKRAATDFLQQLPADFQAGVIIFDQNARLALPLTAADAEGKARLAKSLAGMNYRGPFTDSPAAVERAIFELKTKGRADALKTIVFVSDGVVDTGTVLRDTERAKWLREELSAEAAADGIRIMPIAFTENADLLLIERLAEITRGESVRAVMPTDLDGAYAQMLTRLQALTAAPSAPAVAAAPEAPAAPVAPPAAEAPAAAPPPPPAAEPALAPEPTAAPEPAASPEPAPIAEAPPAAPAAPGGAVELTDEERAALEQLAKDTGVPVEQLMKELEGAPAGQAVVVRPEDMPAPAAASALSTNSLLIGAGAGGLVLAGLAWFFMRGKREPAAAPAAAAPAKSPAAAAAQKPAEAFLLDVHGITSESARRIGSDRQLIVGRTAGSDTEHLDYFVVNKATIGRRHAIIKFKDMAFWLVDQGSVNGTFVNNERVLGERMLKHGDRVKFHKFEFEFSYPDMADSTRTVVGISGDQTIVAAQDATLNASTAALKQDTTPFAATAKTAAVATGAAATAATAAWLNKDALANVPGDLDEDGDPFDITKEGDLDSLESDRNAFFSGSGSQPAYAPPPAPITADGDDTFDDEAAATVALAGMRPLNAPAPAEGPEEDEDFGVEINLDAIGEADNTSLLHKDGTARPIAMQDFDADASAFFDDGTVGPAPDLMKGPTPDLDADLDVLDITAMPAGVGDDDETSNFAPPATVMMSPGDRTGTRPPLDTGKFGELTTVAHDTAETVVPTVSPDDFMDTGAFESGGTLLPETPTMVLGPATSPEEFAGTGMFDDPVPPPVQTINQDVFDVTGDLGDIPDQKTIVLDDSPLHAKKPGSDRP